MARRSVFEVANMLMIFTREGYVQAAELQPLLESLSVESRMIHAFRQSLIS
jgi:hypothetical protein